MKKEILNYLRFILIKCQYIHSSPSFTHSRCNDRRHSLDERSKILQLSTVSLSRHFYDVVKWRQGRIILIFFFCFFLATFVTFPSLQLSLLHRVASPSTFFSTIIKWKGLLKRWNLKFLIFLWCSLRHNFPPLLVFDTTFFFFLWRFFMWRFSSLHFIQILFTPLS